MSRPVPGGAGAGPAAPGRRRGGTTGRCAKGRWTRKVVAQPGVSTIWIVPSVGLDDRLGDGQAEAGTRDALAGGAARR